MISLETKDKRWKEMREDLLPRVRSMDSWISRVTNGTPTDIQIEGGRFGYTYNFDTGKLTVWGKASRCASGSLTVTQIHVLQEIVKEWHLNWEQRLQEATT
ncbi:hypothetical protein [Bacillus thuringiensis]|uniref:hypothetical protein n=1 Tax=Bacillus thuringiensis TaxID=1428 RepID=UPI0011119BB1|nr:hypothetical protein [Bacillus thuringiensis]QCY65029.1 hypothetical protein FHE73_30710 [Bacillus thuringiensis]